MAEFMEMKGLTELSKREGFRDNETDRSHSVTKETIIRTLTEKKWQQNHPNHHNADSYCCLTRSEQITLFRLRTGQNRLNVHLFHKLKTDRSEMCPWDTVPMTTEHLFQHCSLHDDLSSECHMAGNDNPETEVLW